MNPWDLSVAERARNTILVTGGAGFIGSHLVDRLLADGFSVVTVDNFLTGAKENLASHRDHPRFRLIEMDVAESGNLPKDLGRVVAIFHMASPASPIDYAQLPLETLRVGSHGTFHALEWARAHGARFLMASTSEVYGDPLVHPQPESYWGNVNPNGPRSVYDEAKRYAEAATMAFHRSFGVETRIIRIFNTYGPRMRLADGRAIPALVSQALRGEAMTVFGDGSQTRSFCYVSDLVDGICRVMGCNSPDPVNLGNPNEMTILQLAKIIQGLIPGAGKIAYRPLPPDDPKVRKPDIRRAKELLGWEPKVAFPEGLALTLDFFKSVVNTAA